MNYEVYCDESCVEALFDKESHRYAVIGGVWIPSATSMPSPRAFSICHSRLNGGYNSRHYFAKITEE